MTTTQLTPEETAAIHNWAVEMGRRGGRIGGKRCLETMTREARSARALKAARARWRRPVDIAQWCRERGPRGAIFTLTWPDGFYAHCVVDHLTQKRVWFTFVNDEPRFGLRRISIDDLNAAYGDGRLVLDQ